MAVPDVVWVIAVLWLLLLLAIRVVARRRRWRGIRGPARLRSAGRSGGIEAMSETTRRGFLGLFSLLPFRLRLVRSPRKRYEVPPTLWYENSAGQKWIPPDSFYQTMEGQPEGFIYQHSQFPRQLEESICTREGRLATGHSSWPEDLVAAMAADGYTLSGAILVAAHLCERCMNAAAYDYGLKWGYPRYSESWTKAGTSCEHCGGEYERRVNRAARIPIGSLPNDAG